jgi:nucleotide-binding universal stress UspA family protein
MHQFKRILVFTNGSAGSSAAIERAAALARRTSADLTLLCVLETLPQELRPLRGAVQAADLYELAEGFRARLESLLWKVPEVGATCSAKVIFGSPSVEVIREAVRGAHDLVIMAAAGQSVGGRGSPHTVRQLIRKSPCPVWVVTSDASEQHQAVMALVDPMPADREHESLNRRIMQIAALLAQADGSQLHVVHTWLPLTEPISIFGRLPVAAPELVAEVRQEHQMALAELLRESDLAGLKPSVHLVRGETATVIPQVAREKRIDLIVVGATFRTGLWRRIVGTTAEQVLRKVSCSVLVVKPEPSGSVVGYEHFRRNDEDLLPKRPARAVTSGTR